MINSICDTAFVYALAEQKKTIDAEIMREVIREKFENTLLSLQEKGGERKSLKQTNSPAPTIKELDQVKLSEFSKDAAREIFSGLRKKK